MSIRTRGFVFATFFGSCIAVGLLLSSLTTDHWVRSAAKRVNSTNSTGQINYGLFSGSKVLNVGYGPRNHTINVPTLIRTEHNIMNFWLWLGTAFGTGFALFSSAIGALASVLKAASASKKHGTMLLLFVANCSAAISQILAFVCWLVQFYLYLIRNVLTVEDQKLNWYSEGLASIGPSFYFVVVSIFFVIGNIVLLSIAYHFERKERRRLEPLYEEKNQSAIMLY